MKAYYTVNEMGKESLYVPFNFIFFRSRKPYLFSEINCVGFKNSFFLEKKSKIRYSGRDIGRMNRLIRERKFHENENRYIREVDIPERDLGDFIEFCNDDRNKINILFKALEIFENVVEEVESYRFDDEDFVG